MYSILFFYGKGEENSQENYTSVTSVGRFKKTGFGRIEYEHINYRFKLNMNCLCMKKMKAATIMPQQK